MKKIIIAVLMAMMVIWACNKDSSGPDQNNARLTVYVTDAAADYDSVKISFTQVSAHIDSEWVTVQGDPQTVDLLEWSNGRALELGSADVPAGHYTQVRVIIDSAEIGVKGEVFPLDVPSGAKTGLKLGPEFTIEPGSTYELVIDFDVCKSIVVMGSSKHPNGYKLKPHMRLITRATSGSIDGTVTNPEHGPLAYAIQGADTITTSIVDTTGYFMLGFLPEGSYKVSVRDTLDKVYDNEMVEVKAGRTEGLGEITLN